MKFIAVNNYFKVELVILNLLKQRKQFPLWVEEGYQEKAKNSSFTAMAFSRVMFLGTSKIFYPSQKAGKMFYIFSEHNLSQTSIPKLVHGLVSTSKSSKLALIPDNHGLTGVLYLELPDNHGLTGVLYLELPDNHGLTGVLYLELPLGSTLSKGFGLG